MNDPEITIKIPPEIFQEGERLRFQAAMQSAVDFRQLHPNATDDELHAAALLALVEQGFEASWLPRLTYNAEIAFGRLRAAKAHPPGHA